MLSSVSSRQDSPSLARNAEDSIRWLSVDKETRLGQALMIPAVASLSSDAKTGLLLVSVRCKVKVVTVRRHAPASLTNDFRRAVGLKVSVVGRVQSRGGMHGQWVFRVNLWLALICLRELTGVV